MLKPNFTPSQPKAVAYSPILKSSSIAMVNCSSSCGADSKKDSSKLALLAVLLILMMVKWFEARLVSKKVNPKIILSGWNSALALLPRA